MMIGGYSIHMHYIIPISSTIAFHITLLCKWLFTLCANRA